MEVEVKNIGPIAHGRVKVHPLTVFAGPSNSGKTFMATVIYAAAKQISRDSQARKTFPNHTFQPPKEETLTAMRRLYSLDTLGTE